MLLRHLTQQDLPLLSMFKIHRPALGLQHHEFLGTHHDEAGPHNVEQDRHLRACM